MALFWSPVDCRVVVIMGDITGLGRVASTASATVNILSVAVCKLLDQAQFNHRIDHGVEEKLLQRNKNIPTRSTPITTKPWQHSAM
jgi:hypothetical protein